MKKAIAQYKIEGIETTLPFGAFVFRHNDFVSGNFDTHFVKNNFSAAYVEQNQAEDRKIAAVFAVKKYLETIKKLAPIKHQSSIWTKSRNQ
jgi:propionyl-CoA carboxylase alpha chain